MKKGTLLIVDDNPAVLSALQMLLKTEFNSLKAITNPNQLYNDLEKNEPDIVLLDMNFKAGVNTGNEGLFWLKEIKKKAPLAEVVMITAYGDVELAVRSIKEGAADFVLKPWDNEKLKATLEAAYRLRKSGMEISALRSRERQLKAESNRAGQMVTGRSSQMQEIMSLVERIAPTDANVLITGENGTGKEIIAREIHRLSKRSNELFALVDLTSLAESLFESELFGHKKGSFTGATDDKTGRFTMADNGTLFLDEIGNIPLTLQGKILTVLQTRVVSPVGSTKEIPVNFRLVCATNKNLTEMVSRNQFRQDLLYRLNTIKIHLPPLRERPEDIEDLAMHYFMLYARKYDKPALQLSKDAIEKLKRNSWPGNIRELQHTMEKVVILADRNEVNANDLLFLENSVAPSNNTETLEEMEKRMILSTLKKNGFSQKITAEELGITRQTLYNKIKKYEI